MSRIFWFFSVFFLVFSTNTNIVFGLTESDMVVEFLPNDSRADFCTIDGLLSVNVISNSLKSVSEENQPLVLPYEILNDSKTFSFGSISVGVGLYEYSDSKFPVFWAPLKSDLFLLPQQKEIVTAEIDLSHVPLGNYHVKLGVAQGDQLDALANSQKNSPITFRKSTPALTGYPFDLTNEVVFDSLGDEAVFSLVAKNQSKSVLRDYSQKLTLFKGDMPVGSAVKSELSQNVKILPGNTEFLKMSHIFTSPGTYHVLGFSEKINTFLPLVETEFVIGDSDGEVETFISKVGISNLETNTENIRIVACAGTNTNKMRDSVVWHYKISTPSKTLLNGFSTSSVSESLEVDIPKNFDSDFEVVVDLFDNAGDSVESNINFGQKLDSLSKTFTCMDGCMVERSEDEIINNPLSKNNKMKLIYVGIGSALTLFILLILIMFLHTRKKDNIKMHQPE